MTTLYHTVYIAFVIDGLVTDDAGCRVRALVQPPRMLAVHVPAWLYTAPGKVRRWLRGEAEAYRAGWGVVAGWLRGGEYWQLLAG